MRQQLYWTIGNIFLMNILNLIGSFYFTFLAEITKLTFCGKHKSSVMLYNHCYKRVLLELGVSFTFLLQFLECFLVTAIFMILRNIMGGCVVVGPIDFRVAPLHIWNNLTCLTKTN